MAIGTTTALVGGALAGGLASAAAGGAFGGSDPGRTERAMANQAAAQQAAIAQELLGVTRPLRSRTVSDLSGFLTDDVLPEAVGPTLFNFGEESQQFAGLRERLLQTGVRGGQLQEALGNLEIARAVNRENREASLRQRLFDLSLATGFGQAGPALQGLGQASSTFANIGATQNLIRQRQNAALGEGLGSLAGISLLGGFGAFK